MNLVTLALLLVSICCLDFFVAGQKKTTTRSPNVCTKGSIVTFPTYASSTKDVSSSDPLFSKKCKNVSNSFGLWILCISGPKYECLKPATTPTTSTAPTTTTKLTNSTSPTTKLTNSTSPTTAITTTIQPEPNNGCNASQITTTTTPATTGTTTTGTSTTTTPATTGTTTTTNTTSATTGTTTTGTSTTSETTSSTTADASTTPATMSTATVITTTTKTQRPCNSPYSKRFGGGCFIIKIQKMNFFDSRTYCLETGGDLWTSYSLDFFTKFYDVMSYVEEYDYPSTIAEAYLWIGIYGNGTNLYWLNGTVATDKYIAMKLSTGTGPLSDYTNQCVYAYSNVDVNCGWNLMDCSSTGVTNLICELVL